MSDILDSNMVNPNEKKDKKEGEEKAKEFTLLQNRRKSNLSIRQYSNSNVVPQNKIEKPTKIKNSNLIALGYSILF